MNNSISLWASKNKKSAQILIIFTNLCLGFIAYGVGLILSDSVSVAWWQILTLLAFSTFLFQKSNQHNRKGTLLAHLVVITLTFGFWTMIGVKEAHWAASENLLSSSKAVSYAKFAVYAVEPKTDLPFVEEKKSAENTFFSAWKKIISRDKSFVKKYFKPDPNTEISTLILLNILLIILGTAAIVYVGFMAACSLSCNGYVFLAMAATILGALLLFSFWSFFVKKTQKLFKELRRIEAQGNKSKKGNKPPPIAKTDTAPTVTVPAPPPPKPTKKLSKAERRRIRNVDNSVLIVKIVTIGVLLILIGTMVATSIFI